MASRTREEQIGAYVRARPPFRLLAVPPPRYYRLPDYGPPSRPTVEEIANWYLEQAEFRALKLGGWLGTEDGEIIAGAVEQFLPPLYKQDAELLVEALKLAAKMQQKEGLKVAGAWALGSILMASFVALDIRSAKLSPTG